jgi:hypothetical protein
MKTKFDIYMEAVQDSLKNRVINEESNHADEVHSKDSKISGSKMSGNESPMEMAKRTLASGEAKETENEYIASPAKLWVFDAGKKIGSDALIKVSKIQNYPKDVEEGKKSFSEDGVEWVLRPNAEIPVRVFKNKSSKEAKKLAIIGPDKEKIWTAFPIADEKESISPPLTKANIDFWKEHGFAGK